MRPNLGIQYAYQRKLDDLIERMVRAVQRAVESAWREKPPTLAQDDSPAVTLAAAVNSIGREWLDRFEEFARESGRRFAKDATGQADRTFAAALRDIGFTVRFKMTPAANDVIQATINEQIGLIRSIPQEYMTQIRGAVMRSIQTGRDLNVLATELRKHAGVTKRRAALIARDQNNKATATIVRVRQQEVGITEAIWLHSAGGKTPRPTHVANSGKKYTIETGWFDPAVNEHVWPGTLINCRCVSRSIVPGLE